MLFRETVAVYRENRMEHAFMLLHSVYSMSKQVVHILTIGLYSCAKLNCVLGTVHNGPAVGDRTPESAVHASLTTDNHVTSGQYTDIQL
jgi:hypothetical protein